MNEITFNGPYHFNDIDPKTGKLIKNQNNIPEPNMRGIYIWGFMYYYNSNGLIAPINFNKETSNYDSSIMQFIPYYVGKSESNIFMDRITKHHDVRNISKKSDADKYIRFSHGYMHEFFKDEKFPIKIGSVSRASNLISLNKEYPNAITYHNELKVLKNIYPLLDVVTVDTNQPITVQSINGELIPDTLDDIVNQKNNFWFCYATFPDKNINLLEIETSVYYSLKGKTISMTEKYNNQTIKINSNLNIFDEVASANFKGYI